MATKLTLSDYPPGAMYASGTDSKGRWKWKPVDQKYVDQLNGRIDALGIKPEPEKKQRKKRGTK